MRVMMTYQLFRMWQNLGETRNTAVIFLFIILTVLT